ncbi:MAG: molybdopterin-dependent oxidoreductase [Nocardioides sp.]|nr:molybdopterin-dependent oxidoreductase [Nocardioides sp.]
MTATPEVSAPQHVVANPALGTWMSVADGSVVVQVGKVELGQGILTALAQIAADALELPVTAVRMRAAHTADGPDEGLTAGSLSVLQAGPALRHVGAVVRALTGGPGGDLSSYVARIAGLDPATDLRAVTPAAPARASAVGRSEARLDLPDKVLGRPRYLADLRPEGLRHGRVLRPAVPGATLADLAHVDLPGVKVVRDGSFVGVVGPRESDVDTALARLAAAATWSDGSSLPDEDDLSAWLRSGPHEEIAVLDEGGPVTPTHHASYSKPFLAHASIAPSCAMARWTTGQTGDRLHVWSHSQGIHALRDAITSALGLGEGVVTVEHVENAGCYGHNAADDAAFDAVLLARATPGSPVLTRWSRSDELTWGPLSPPMTATLGADLVGGRIRGWSHDVWSLGHTSRPGYAGAPGLLAAGHRADPSPVPPPTDPPLAAGGGTTRNSVPIYAVGPRRVTGHRRTMTPLRTSAMRALGAYLNVFAIESFMDELALSAGADPVAFRLAHLDDPRAAHVVRRAADLGGWGRPLPDDTGRGIGFARYKDKGAWCAVVAEVAVDHEVRVRRLTVVADLGLVVNPDGARNQLEGGATQATSWTTTERVRFDRRRITSDDWETYPILGFAAAPLVSVELVDSAAPSVGAGEAAQGPTAAAIANAVHHALGVRVRDLPLNADAVVRAIESTE